MKIKAQVSSICAKWCILMTVCVLSDLTWLPHLGEGRKSWYIIIIIKFEDILLIYLTNNDNLLRT